VPPGTPPAPFLDSQYTGDRRVLAMTSSTRANAFFDAAWGKVNLVLASGAASDEHAWYQNLKNPSLRGYGSALDASHVVAQVDLAEQRLHVMFTLYANAGPTFPVEFSSYEVSRDYGRTWTRVDRGMPRIGEWVRRAGPAVPVVDSSCASAGLGRAWDLHCHP